MSVDRLKELLLKSPYPWWQWDAATNEVSFSPLKATMIGFDPQELSGRGYQAFTELVHPEDEARTMEAMRRVLYGEVPLYQVDYRIRDKQGEYHWFMDRGVVLETVEGRARCIRGIVIDLGREALMTGSPELARAVILRSLLHRPRETTSFLAVCAGCRRVKALDHAWVELTPELATLLGEQTTHGLCPDCLRRLYPELDALRP